MAPLLSVAGDWHQGRKGGKMCWLNGLEKGLLLSGNVWASRFVAKIEHLICKLNTGYSLHAARGCVSA